MIKKLTKKINESPINYFSDLFIVIMVIAWAIAMFLIALFAMYSTLILQDNSLWGEFVTLVATPLTAGGALWMIKNGVQHAITNNRGKKCDPDFPKVEVDDDEIEQEEVLKL